MARLFYFSLFLIFIQATFQYTSHLKEDFDGTLTTDVLLDWGFTSQSTLMNLARRGIKTIAPNSFAEFSNLLTLTLDGNMIEKIDLNMFTGLNRLSTLSFQNNSIKSISDNALATDVPNLKVLFLL